MGHSHSKNIANDITLQLNSVINTGTQGCTNSISASQVASFEGIQGNITLDGDTWNQSVEVNAQCLQSLVNSTQLSNSMNSQVAQTAKATNSSLGLTGASATNVTNAIQQLGNAIVNSYTAECANVTSQDQVLQYKDDVGNITIVDTDFNQTQNSILGCIQKSNTVSQASNNLEQVISQYAKSSISSLWLIIIAVVLGIIILVVIVAIVFIVVKGQKSAVEFAKTPAGQELIKGATMAVAPELAIPGMIAK